MRNSPVVLIVHTQYYNVEVSQLPKGNREYEGGHNDAKEREKYQSK